MQTRLFSLVSSRSLRLCLSTALAAGLLTGCTVAGGRPEKFAAGARGALEHGKLDKAIDLAEQAVLADPRNPSFRVLLGNAYMRAGRFVAARQALDEAMELGEDTGKTALALALADLALGKQAEAVDTLSSYRDAIPASDFGLALALAGQTAQGIAVLTDTLRAGDVSPKVRQNLALAYALDGRWREARVMASQDVTADQLDARITEWALMAKPQDGHKRVASLLGVPVRADSGQPERLALANFPDAAQLAEAAAPAAVPAEAAAPAPALAEAAVQELAALDTPAAAPASTAEAAVAAPVTASGPLAAIDLPASAPAAAPADAQPAFVTMESVPVVQPVPAAPRRVVRAPRTVTAQAKAPAVASAGTHLVQLGSFASAEGARRAWRHFSTRNPALAGYRNVTTQVTVNGRQFWRVQAAGFAAGSAFAMCRTVKARGGACLVMAAPRNTTPQGRPVDTRFARRR